MAKRKRKSRIKAPSWKEVSAAITLAPKRTLKSVIKVLWTSSSKTAKRKVAKMLSNALKRKVRKTTKAKRKVRRKRKARAR